MDTVIGNTYNSEFKLNRVVGKQLVSGYVNIRLGLEFNPESTRAQQALALKSMKKWLADVLENAVAFNAKSDFPTETLEFLDNHMMFCPDEPYDFMLMVLIYSKVNAIGDGHITVEHLEISSDISDGFSNWVEGDVSEFLPTAEEWLGEYRYFDSAWWDRSDGGMVELWAEPGDDITATPDIFIPLDDVDISTIVNNIDEWSAEIIKPNFKPTILRND
jgi:hypothetical protein